MNNVYTRLEYDRRGEFDPVAASKQWDKEEEEERRRQLEDRWLYFERRLPAGAKCDERLRYEALLAEKEKAQRDAEAAAERRRAEQRQKFFEARAKKAALEAQTAAAAAADAMPPPPVRGLGVCVFVG